MPIARIRSLCLIVFAAFLFLSMAPLRAQTIMSTPAPSGVASRLTRPINERARVALTGSVHPLARPSNDRGLAPDSMPLTRLKIVLKRSDAQEATLRQLISDVHTPGSANYHKWLTPDQFGQQFGPSDADVATLEAWLSSHGFSITGLSPGRQTLEVSGTVAGFRSAFHADIHHYQVNGQTHYANATDPEIPTALAPVFGGFASLNNFQIKHYSKALGHAAYDPATHKATPNWTVSYPTETDFVFAPADFAVQYDLNPLYTAGTNGAGQTIAIINESNINVYLVNQFRSLFGLPANPPQIVIDGNDPGLDGINDPDGLNNASIEAYLDVEWAGAVAPSATIDLVIAADTELESGLILAAEHAVYSNLAPVMSISFGQCEVVLGSENQFLSSLYEQAAAQGITVMVSTGDSGSAGCDDPDSQAYAVAGQAVSGFASTPYNVAVGGTDFYYSSYSQGQGSAAVTTQLQNYWNTTPSNNAPAVSIKGPIPEQPWNDSQYGLDILSNYTISGSTTIAAGSGGASTCGNPAVTCAPYTKPSWQTGAGVPADGVRDIPDVSLFASDGLNYSYYPICATDGDCQSVASGGTVQIFGVGGTSASSPAFAGIMALVNQKYGRQGQADFVLYPLAAQYPAAFHDVTNGTNSVPCATGTSADDCIAVSNPLTITDPTYGPAVEGQIGTGTTPEYNAGTGYDLATGIGTVDANVLLTDWNKVSFATSATTLTPSSTSFAHGTPITVSGTVTGTTPTGSVALLADSTEPMQQGQVVFPLTNGSFSSSVTTLPGGTYNIWGQYSGDNSNHSSASTKTQITVTPENSGMFFSLASGGSIVPTGSTQSYGTLLDLSGQVAPSSQLATLQQCETTANVTCPVFTVPTGSITFADSGSAINIAAINAEGDAEYSETYAVGSHSITAAYSGDKSYNGSTGSAMTFTVTKNTPSIGLNASNQNSSSQFIGGQSTVLTIFVVNSTAVNGPAAAPSGTITLTGLPAGTTPTTATLSPVVTLSNGLNEQAPYGVATVTVPAQSTASSPTVTISYAGDTNYNSTAASGNVPFLAPVSGLLPSTTTATESAAVTSPAAAVTINVIVTGQTGHAAPTGSIYLYGSGNSIDSASLSAATSTTATATMTLNSEDFVQGTNLLSVQYSGDTTYLPSVTTLNVANPLNDFTLNPATVLVAVPASGIATDAISVGSRNGFTGAVNLTCTAATGVTCSFSPASTTLTADGNTTSTLTINTAGVTAAGNYNVVVTGKDAATGTYIHTLTITANTGLITTPSFALSNSGGITIATQGATTGNTSTITVTPNQFGFTGAVNLSCAVTSSPVGATNQPTCSLSPASVTITGTTAMTAILTVSTTANTAALHGLPLERLFAAGAGFTMAALLFFGFPSRRRNMRSLLGVLAFAAVLSLGLGLAGCGGGSSTSGGGTTTTPPNNGTTLGTYTVTVTGTSGSITAPTAVTVNVN